MKRALPLLLILLVGAGLGAGGYAKWEEYLAEEEFDGTFALYGNVEIRDAQLAFNGEEHLTAVHVEEGDEVVAGQLLAELATDRLETAMAQARAQIAAQEALVQKLENGSRKQEIEQTRAEVDASQERVRNAERTVQRLQETAETGASSAQTLDDAQSRLRTERAVLRAKEQVLDLAEEGPRQEDIAQAKAQLEAQRDTLKLLAIRLEDSKLTAPSPGIIQSRLREPGEFVNPAVPVFTLALTEPKWVRAYLPEPDLGKVKPGMAAWVESDSYPGERFDGWVGFISPRAEFTPKTVETSDLRTKLVYEVRVFVHDPENRLRLGQPVTARIDPNATRHPSQQDTPPEEADGTDTAS